MATTSKPRTSKPTSASRSGARSKARPEPAVETSSNGAAPPQGRSKLVGPALAAGATVAGIAGGIVLGRRALPRRRRFPSLPTTIDLKQVGRASKRFGELTKELRKAGEQAERLGDALS